MMVRSRLRGIVGARPGCRRTRRRDGDVRLSDGRSPAAGCTGGQDRNGGTDRVAKGRRATNSERIGRRACRPGRRYVASGRGRAVHGHRCHRPTDGEVADDLHGARHRRWPRLPDGRYLVSAIIGRNLDPQEAGIWVYDLTGQTPPRRIFEKEGEPYWANDGRQVSHRCAGRSGYREVRDLARQCRWHRPDQAADPRGRLVLDCSRDGTWLATRTIGGEPDSSGPADLGPSGRHRRPAPDRRFGERPQLLLFSALLQSVWVTS